ncbi:MAG: type II toxin-antitoxin system Phd/YefM family antitoxin [Alphaproteobacteria bacterium]|nr:type II toxin-antitoxin system Phd/YefM family antitoxin [Alphaproteobacteria bacterium]
MSHITIHKAKTELSRLIKRAEAGEEIVLARGKVPVARLVPYRGVEPGRQFGRLRGRLNIADSFFEPLPEGELEAWEK